jgi:hypothetical protein
VTLSCILRAIVSRMRDRGVRVPAPTTVEKLAAVFREVAAWQSSPALIHQRQLQHHALRCDHVDRFLEHLRDSPADSRQPYAQVGLSFHPIVRANNSQRSRRCSRSGRLGRCTGCQSAGIWAHLELSSGQPALLLAAVGA